MLRASCPMVRATGVSRTGAVRPVCVAVPRAQRLVACQATDKNTVAALALSMETVTVEVTSFASAPGADGVVNVLSSTNFQAFIQENAGKLAIVDFYTDWCGPCKMIAPQLEKMAAEADSSKVIFAKLNCGLDNDSKRLAVALGIKALPTFHLYKDGKMQSQMTGAKAQALQDLIAKHL